MARFLGYDPGGNGRHGVALLETSPQGRVLGVSTTLVYTADDAWKYFVSQSADGLGVDTLTEWCLGKSGWRSADLWLQTRYPSQTHPQVYSSIVNPNFLCGSMCVNGMGILQLLRRKSSELPVTEVHPKVLYYELFNAIYDWKASRQVMVQMLMSHLGSVPLSLSSDHEFDALLSAWACANGVLGRWKNDLHALPPVGTIVQPVGPTNYFWP